jgi:hypothetical protein
MCNRSSACEYIIEGHLLGEPTHAGRSLSPNTGRPGRPEVVLCHFEKAASLRIISPLETCAIINIARGRAGFCWS